MNSRVDACACVVVVFSGAPQYLYKYYILVDDKVYVPSSTLSPGQLARLRSVLENNPAAAPSSGVVVVPVTPAGRPVIASTTAAPTTVGAVAVTPASADVVVLAPLVAAQTDNYNFSDTINLAVG